MADIGVRDVADCVRRVARVVPGLEQMFGIFVHRWNPRRTTVHRQLVGLGRLSVATPSV